MGPWISEKISNIIEISRIVYVWSITKSGIINFPCEWSIGVCTNWLSIITKGHMKSLIYYHSFAWSSQANMFIASQRMRWIRHTLTLTIFHESELLSLWCHVTLVFAYKSDKPWKMNLEKISIFLNLNQISVPFSCCII